MASATHLSEGKTEIETGDDAFLVELAKGMTLVTERTIGQYLLRYLLMFNSLPLDPSFTKLFKKACITA